MLTWIDRAYAEIEQEYERGDLTQEEYRRALRDLQSEIDESNEDRE
jgi:hypothetical protein